MTMLILSLIFIAFTTIGSLLDGVSGLRSASQMISIWLLLMVAIQTKLRALTIIFRAALCLHIFSLLDPDSSLS